MASPLLTGVLVGFVPAMALLYAMLHRYEGFFDERRVFRALLVGMLAGALVTFGQFFFAPATQLSSGAGVATVVVGFPALEAAVMTAALNRRQYRGRKDTPYYAAAFGLGMGALNALLLAGAADALRLSEAAGATFAFYAVLVLLAVAGVMVRAGAAVAVGRSTALGLPFTGMLRGLALLLPFGVIVGAVGYFSALQSGAGMAVGPVAVLAYGAFVMRWAQRRVLDEIVPDELAQHVRREMRKRMRPGAEAEAEAEAAAGGGGDVAAEPREPPSAP